MSRRQRRERRNRRQRHAEPRGLRTRQSLITGATVTAGALAGFTSSAAAAEFQVDNLSDNPLLNGCNPTTPNDCSLRGAVNAADSGGDAIDNITFQSGLSGQITLTNGQIPILTEIYFLGPGANTLRISGYSSDRIFNIDEGTAGTPVGIYDLSLMYGHATTGSGNGGDGGAIYNRDAQLKVVRSILSKNTSDHYGGAVFERGDFNNGYSDYFVDSTITSNTAAAAGGGLYSAQSLGTIENSTVSGNHSTGGVGGGGVASFTDTIVNDSTIANNTALRGGGVFVYTDGRYDDLANTLVADNTATVYGPDIFGSFNAQFSLVENPSAVTNFNSVVAGSNITGVDPQLNGLTENGGPTPTQLPAVTSPAIDQGKRAGPGRDQRGLPRPFDVPTIPNSAAGGDGSDIGAVELQAGELPSNAFALGKVKGKTLPVSVGVPGTVSVVDAASPLRAGAAKVKKLLKPSSASGGPPRISVKLLLTKLAKQKLRQKGKVRVNARITFTPNRGIPKAITQKLKIKGKRKK